MMSVSEAVHLTATTSFAAPVVVATDGKGQSDGALMIGGMLAPRADALRIVSVTRPVPIVPESGMVISDAVTVARRSEMQRMVASQLRRTLETIEPFEILEGDPATVVAQVAHDSGASMIVCGLGRHRVSDRIFGEETALRLIRRADVPVFAAVEGLDQLPSRIVVACDFSDTSFRAARAAIELCSARATLYLVHVGPRGVKGEMEEWSRAYRQEAAEALLSVEQILAPSGMVVERVLLEGDPATEVLSFATGVRADLIATGSHGRGFVARMLIGSVATRIVRASTCSVLTVPGEMSS